MIGKRIDRVRVKVLFCCAAALLLAADWAFAAAPQVIYPTGQKMVGTGIRVTRGGVIMLQTAQGEITCPTGSVAIVDEPKELAAAVQMIQQKQFDGAIERLSKIVTDYRGLQWDNKARRPLAAATLGKGNYAAAIRLYDELFANAPESRAEGDVRGGYLKALLGAKDYAKLKPILDETVASSPRPLAAAAQMMRGDMSFAKGEVDLALYDFMRTAEFFRDAKDLQAEALFKTAECLEKLGDARAAEYYARVAAGYPETSFGAEAKKKKP